MERDRQTYKVTWLFFSAYAVISFALRARNNLYVSFINTRSNTTESIGRTIYLIKIADRKRTQIRYHFKISFFFNLSFYLKTSIYFYANNI
jgi:hypothetical protein